MKRLRIGFCLAALFLLLQTGAHAQQKPQRKSPKQPKQQEQPKQQVQSEQETQPISKITFSKKQNELRLYGKDQDKPFKTITMENTYDVRTYDAVKKDSVWLVGIENGNKGVVICTVDSLGKQTVCTYYPQGEAFNLKHNPKTSNVPAVLENKEWKHKDK